MTGISVCVFCASGTADPDSLALAAAFGTEIGRRGWQLVSGGGSISMMGALARSARAAGAHTVGVIPGALAELEVADTDADELIVTVTMSERKRIMAERADAFVTLPGGIGTLEELFEVWTGGYLGMHDKPVVLLDPRGHYRQLLDWLAGLQHDRFVSPAALARLSVVTDAGAALDLCGGHQP
ncbi:TIGR00730 family Rossman fold protein [Skermania piniformis]|uniref:LOG family protein n=1 Tax=Skermania pinensis TaxID=39122 RepID=UPI000B1E2B4B|nr:TIGR00730 family Rossman fold protein [Skermania piniformis]